MHIKAIEIITALVLGILIPSLLVTTLKDKVASEINVENSAVAKQTESVSHANILVLEKNNEVIEMALEDYVLSVVLCEMPADFEIEALKAQAVVARTYALRRAQKGGKHKNAAVCTKSSCCQGVCTPDTYLQNGGTQESVNRVRSAVAVTSGLVLVYEGKLIDATYFSCSGGATEDARAVWGTEIPYLKSVDSPGEEKAKHYVDTIKLSAYDFLTSLGLPYQKVAIERIVHTSGDGVESLEICGTRFTGTQLRKMLNLRSTAFYISSVGDTVTITTKGFGHRVGMSQYGADAMAVNGASFQQILAHYYQNVQLIPFDID